jgi:hypothetical protein
MIVTGPFQCTPPSCFLAILRKDRKLGFKPRFGPASCWTRNKFADFARWLVEFQGIFLVTIRHERNLLEINVGLLGSNCAHCDRITLHVWWVLSFIGVTATVMQNATQQHFYGVLLGCGMQRVAGVTYGTYFNVLQSTLVSLCNPDIVITDIPHYTFPVNAESLV